MEWWMKSVFSLKYPWISKIKPQRFCVQLLHLHRNYILETFSHGSLLPCIWGWNQLRQKYFGGGAFCFFTIYSYTCVLKSKGQRVVLIRNISKMCISELFKSQNKKSIIAEKEAREDEKKINILVYRLAFVIHISYVHRSFKSSKLNVTTLHLWAQGRGRHGSRGHCATAAAQQEPV